MLSDGLELGAVGLASLIQEPCCIRPGSTESSIWFPMVASQVICPCQPRFVLPPPRARAAKAACSNAKSAVAS